MVNKNIRYTSSFLQTVFAVICIIMVAIGLRVYKLESVPGILNRDEAALAYNAKLLLESGQDEWNKSWPIQFRSFGDYKLPGYILSIIVSFSLFGQNDFSVRLPSVMAGVVNIVLLGLLMTKIVDTRTRQSAIIQTLLMGAITPFLIFYSRMAWEANLGLSSFLISILILFQTEVTGKHLFSGSLFYILAIFTYNTPLLLFPMLFVCLLFFYWPLQRIHWWTLSSVFVVFILGVISLGSVSSQKGNITIFSNETIIAEYPEFRQSLPVIVQPIIGNKYVYWMKLITERYVETWLPHFLVFEGGKHPWQSLPGSGHLFLVQYILSIFGVIFLIIEVAKRGLEFIRTKKPLTYQTKWRIVFLSLLFLSPLPAVITVDAPHTTRSLFFLVMLVGCSVYSLIRIAELSDKSKLTTVLLQSVIWVMLLFSSIQYLQQYFINWPQNYPPVLMVGFAEVLATTDHSQSVAIIDPEGYAYITVAWYSKFTPDQFFSTIQRHQPDQAGLSYGFKVGNYTFYKDEKDIQGEKIILYQDSSSAWLVKNL